MAEIREVDGVAVVKLGKRYDSLVVQELDKLSDDLLTIVNDHATPKLVLDFSQTEYINSSFIEIAFRAWKRALQKDGALACCCLDSFCSEVLHVTRLDKIWPAYNSPEEAIKALSQKP